MCTVLLLPVVNPIEVNKYLYININITSMWIQILLMDKSTRYSC